ncbi:MAG: RrF2 family transcriptional regulator [Gemmatimonadaceae bacterium]
MLPLTQTAEYALRAMLHIAAHHPAPVRVVALVDVVKAPANYLSKTLHQLARAGLLVSTRGPLGGFRLAEDPETVTLDRVIAVFAGHAEQRCLLGHGRCGRNPDCTIHARWKRVAADMQEFFTTTTVADLIGREDRPSRRGRRPRSAATPTRNALANPR